MSYWYSLKTATGDAEQIEKLRNCSSVLLAMTSSEQLSFNMLTPVSLFGRLCSIECSSVLQNKEPLADVVLASQRTSPSHLGRLSPSHSLRKLRFCLGPGNYCLGTPVSLTVNNIMISSLAIFTIA